MSYEIQFRGRVLSRLASGLSQRETAKWFGISRNTLADWLAREKNGQGLAPRKRAPKPKKIKPARLDKIIRETPDIYGCEIAALLGCSRAAVCYALRRHGYTLKKNPRLQGARRKTAQGLPRNHRRHRAGQTRVCGRNRDRSVPPPPARVVARRGRGARVGPRQEV